MTNLGGFELHGDTSASEIVDRVLAMLNQYLISHQNLQLDESFKVYVKILSSEHSAQKRIIKIRAKRKNIARGHVGGRRSQTCFLKLWGIDVQGSSNISDPLYNKCVLICALLGKFQNELHKRLNKKFLCARYLNSNNAIKKKYAYKLLMDELSQVLELAALNSEGPYVLEDTLNILSTLWKSQFFVFEGVSQSKSRLSVMYPNGYDDSLMPIYLYRPHNENHIIFIQNIHAYFRHNGKVCFECKQTYKSLQYQHFCKFKKSCFACHRYLQKPSTYIHDKLERQFCNINIVPEIMSKCPNCNCKLFSQLCKRAHKLLCYSKGFFGWLCDLCETFTYRSKNLNSEQLKKTHVCGSFKTCRYCYLPQEINHLCTMKKEKAHGTLNRLAICQLQLSIDNELVVALIFREELKRCNFTKYSFFHSKLELVDSLESDLEFRYHEDEKIEKFPFPKRRTTKNSFDYNSNIKKIANEINSIEKTILQHFLQEDNFQTSYIMLDEENNLLVSLDLRACLQSITSRGPFGRLGFA